MFIIQSLIVVPVNVLMEVESITYQPHQAVLFVKVILTLLLTPTLVSAHAKLVIIMFLKAIIKDPLFASHVWQSFVELVPPIMLLNAVLVLSEPPKVLTKFVHVSQDIMNLMVLVKFVQLNVMDVK